MIGEVLLASVFSDSCPGLHSSLLEEAVRAKPGETGVGSGRFGILAANVKSVAEPRAS